MLKLALVVIASLLLFGCTGSTPNDSKNVSLGEALQLPEPTAPEITTPTPLGSGTPPEVTPAAPEVTIPVPEVTIPVPEVTTPPDIPPSRTSGSGSPNVIYTFVPESVIPPVVEIITNLNQSGLNQTTPTGAAKE